MTTRYRKYFRTLLAGSLVFGGVIVASVIGSSLPASAAAVVQTIPLKDLRVIPRGLAS
jgi:hypothetical protein